jgi:hypothetical protein
LLNNYEYSRKKFRPKRSKRTPHLVANFGVYAHTLENGQKKLM